MKTYSFERVIAENGVVILPDNSMKELKKHRVRFTVSDLETSASEAGNVLHEMTDESGQTDEYDRLLGLFSDEPELIDEITEWAMKNRENEPLRYRNG